MMQLTPSAKSSFLAGAALSVVAWLTLMKVDSIPIIRRFLKKDRIFDWMSDNKSLTLIGTEVANFGIHGVTNSTSVTFALGSTVINAIVIFIMLPFRKRSQNRRDVVQLESLYGRDIQKARRNL